MKKAEIKKLIEDGILLFLKHHTKLLEVDANERSITHKFAECLAFILGSKWDVDCEYNRDGYEPKRIGLDLIQVSNNDEEAHTVFPDIIIHKRGLSGTENNLLVIEAKKDAKISEKNNDKNKIKLIMRDMGYQFGVFLNFKTGSDGNVEYEFVNHL